MTNTISPSSFYNQGSTVYTAVNPTPDQVADVIPNAAAAAASAAAAQANATALADALISQIQFVMDGGGSVLTPGLKGFLLIDFPFTINQWSLIADQAGSCVIDVFSAAYPTIPSASITASAKPTLSSQQVNQSTALTGWTTTIPANTLLGFNVTSASTVTRVTLDLKVTRT